VATTTTTTGGTLMPTIGSITGLEWSLSAICWDIA